MEPKRSNFTTVLTVHSMAGKAHASPSELAIAQGTAAMQMQRPTPTPIIMRFDWVVDPTIGVEVFGIMKSLLQPEYAQRITPRFAAETIDYLYLFERPEAHRGIISRAGFSRHFHNMLINMITQFRPLSVEHDHLMGFIHCLKECGSESYLPDEEYWPLISFGKKALTLLDSTYNGSQWMKADYTNLRAFIDRLYCTGLLPCTLSGP